MTYEEKQQLLDLFNTQDRWCQNAEARDAADNGVCFDDPGATRWDITGGLCKLFGWNRASQLFEVVQQHLHGSANGNSSTSIDAMAALQDYNDDEHRTFDQLVAGLESLPVWQPAGPAD